MKQYKLTKPYVTPRGDCYDQQKVECCDGRYYIKLRNANVCFDGLLRIYPDAMLQAGYDGIAEITPEEFDSYGTSAPIKSVFLPELSIAEADRISVLKKLFRIAHEENDTWEPDWHDIRQIKLSPIWDYSGNFLRSDGYSQIDFSPDLPKFRSYSALETTFSRLSSDEVRQIFRVFKRHPWLPVKEEE